MEDNEHTKRGSSGKRKLKEGVKSDVSYRLYTGDKQDANGKPDTGVMSDVSGKPGAKGKLDTSEKPITAMKESEKPKESVKSDVSVGAVSREGCVSVAHAGRRILPIAVPFGKGAGVAGTELGPQALLGAGLIERLSRLGHKLEPCEWVDAATAQIGIVDRQLADDDLQRIWAERQGGDNETQRSGSMRPGADEESSLLSEVGGQEADAGSQLNEAWEEESAPKRQQYESKSSEDLQCAEAPSKRDVIWTAIKNKHEVEHMSRLTADSVEQAVRRSAFPILLGGDHSTAIGTLAGLSRCHNRLGVIWLDAHGDLNTERTTPSGNMHGMVLAIAMGLGVFKLTDIGVGSRLIDPKNIVLVGARDLDEGEREFIKSSGIHCFTMREIDRLGMEEAAARALAIADDGTDAVHLSLDMDSLDPLEAPGVGTPVPGGIIYREARLAMELFGASGKIGSLDIVELNPSLDQGKRTAALAVELAAALLGGRLL
ncbi:arginase [Paenibacillus sp. HB172176]|uniref:arginase n=1 Tax=Paenibacillus sp. HB172176 TaxID=2493690 RepID=UPI00143BFC45|nr:arginase [Paenibacillus sp. HB172176]